MASEQKKNIAKDIIKTANTIRAKYNILKSSNILHKSQLEDVFKSISKPLNKLVQQGTATSNIQANPPAKRIKLEKFKVKHDNSDDDDKEYDDSSIKSNGSENVDTTFYTDDDDDAITSIESSSNSKASGNNYLQKLLEGVDNGNLDTNFGVRIVAGEFMIGSSKLTISGDVLTLDDSKKFYMTKGLCELIFMKIPDVKLYNQSDLEKYGEILKQSKVYRRNFKSDNPISGNRGHKYTKIIKPLLHSGNGGHFDGGGGSASLMQLNNSGTEYVYWNDPSELIARLRLLMASKNAGNNNHSNEIMSIIEELREAKIIE